MNKYTKEHKEIWDKFKITLEKIDKVIKTIRNEDRRDCTKKINDWLIKSSTKDCNARLRELNKMIMKEFAKTRSGISNYAKWSNKNKEYWYTIYPFIKSKVKRDMIEEIISEVEEDIKRLKSMIITSQTSEGKILIKKDKGFIKMLEKKLGELE